LGWFDIVKSWLTISLLSDFVNITVFKAGWMSDVLGNFVTDDRLQSAVFGIEAMGIAGNLARSDRKEFQAANRQEIFPADNDFINNNAASYLISWTPKHSATSMKIRNDKMQGVSN
jgi:hypothetical protein